MSEITMCPSILKGEIHAESPIARKCRVIGFQGYLALVADMDTGQLEWTAVGNVRLDVSEFRRAEEVLEEQLAFQAKMRKRNLSEAGPDLSLFGGDAGDEG